MSDKVVVIMNYDENVKVFSDLAFQINKKYCERYGHDLRRYNRVFDSNFNMSFQKVWLLIEVLQECMRYKSNTHVMWIDSDACINIHSRHKLTDFLPRYDRYASFSEDMQRFSIFEQGGVSINAGVMIFRVCNESIQLLEKVIRRCYTMPKPIPFWEQGAFMDLIHSGHISMEGVMFFPYNTLQTFPEAAVTGHPPSYQDPSAFIYHFPNAKANARVKYMQEMILTLPH